jgi:hypothetical protein
MADSKYANLITDDVLNGLKQTESSNDPYAVNPKSGAIGAYQHLPTTIQMLHKQGIKYNPMDEQQQRGATKQYLVNLLDKNGGDLNAALAQYGGHKKEDPTNYINKVMSKSKSQPQVNPQDDFDALMFGTSKTSNVKQQPAQAQGDEFDAMLSNTTAPTQKAQTTQSNVPAYKKVFNQLEAQNKNEPLKVQKQIASLADVALGVPAAVVNIGTYAGARTLQKTPEEAERIAGKASSYLENPIGKAAGITESPAYQQEGSRQVMDYIAQNIHKGSQYVADKTGMNVKDVENIANSLSFAAIPEAGKFATKAATKLVTSKSLSDQFATKKRQMPIQGEIAPTETVAAAPTTTVKFNPNVGFAPAEYAEKSLPPEEQAARAEVLHRIDPNLKVDPNVIEGRGKDRSTDFQISKTDTPLGNLTAEKLKEEKAALNNYGEKLIEETGDRIGLDESASHNRGNNTLKYFKELENHFDEAISRIYKERDEVAKTIPVSGDNIKSALTDSVTLELGDNAKLAKASTAKLKQLGMMDKDGNMLPSDGYKAEQFRKWLNEKGVWDRSNAKLHSELKRAVDEDVISTIDPNTPLYKEARELHGLKKDTLENPKGISSILESSGPNGINRQVDIQNIPSAIEKMSVEQFTHLIDTINKAPKELKESAQKSLSSIKSQFLNRAHEAFQKSANAGTKYLKQNNEVMARLFTPEEMAKINDYNAAAHILKTDTGYPGAKVQDINIEKKLPTKMVEQFIRKGGAVAAETLTGGTTMGVAGAMAHEALAGRQSRKEARSLEKIHKQNLEKKKAGFTNLTDITKMGKKD